MQRLWTPAGMSLQYQIADVASTRGFGVSMRRFWLTLGTSPSPMQHHLKLIFVCIPVLVRGVLVGMIAYEGCTKFSSYVPKTCSCDGPRKGPGHPSSASFGFIMVHSIWALLIYADFNARISMRGPTCFGCSSSTMQVSPQVCCCH